MHKYIWHYSIWRETIICTITQNAGRTMGLSEVPQQPSQHLTRPQRNQGCDQMAPRRVAQLPLPCLLSQRSSNPFTGPAWSIVEQLPFGESANDYPSKKKLTVTRQTAKLHFQGSDKQHSFSHACSKTFSSNEHLEKQYCWVKLQPYESPLPALTLHSLKEQEGKHSQAQPHGPLYLVALVSLIGSAPRGVREDVRLGMLVHPELLLACLQQLCCFHHVLHILVLIKSLSQEAGKVAVLISTDRD